MLTDLKSLIKQVEEIAIEAGSFIVEQGNKFNKSMIEVKGIHDYVSYVDKTSERMIVDGLSKILPESGFIAEEGTSAYRSEDYNWIIDPLDGTTNFIHGLAPFCVSIALHSREGLILGVIYEPNSKEIFSAGKGLGATLNGRSIHVSETPDLDNSLLATGFPYYDYSLMDQYIDLFKWCMVNTRGVRRLGSAAMDLAYVACGRLDGFFEYGLSPWDVAAGALIVEEAGGIVTDFSGGSDFLFNKELLAFNPKISDDFLKIAKGIFSS